MPGVLVEHHVVVTAQVPRRYQMDKAVLNHQTELLVGLQNKVEDVRAVLLIEGVNGELVVLEPLGIRLHHQKILV